MGIRGGWLILGTSGNWLCGIGIDIFVGWLEVPRLRVSKNQQSSLDLAHPLHRQVAKITDA